MPCYPINDGVVCTFIDEVANLEPYGAKVWVEMHSYLGPTFYRSKNCITPIQKPSAKTWRAFTAWEKAREKH